MPNDPDLQERVRFANFKLLEKFGVSPEHDREEIIEAFKRRSWPSRTVQSVLPSQNYAWT
jgi:hypothetical protein